LGIPRPRLRVPVSHKAHLVGEQDDSRLAVSSLPMLFGAAE
jgi:hypothetical protein